MYLILPGGWGGKTRNTVSSYWLEARRRKLEAVKMHAEDSKKLCVSPFPQRISVKYGTRNQFKNED